jgi:PAS domain S-box-containing protein
MAVSPTDGTNGLSERLEHLRGLADRYGGTHAATLREALQEWQTTIEELRVAEEELRQQNEELLAAVDQVAQAQQRYRELFDFAPDGYLVTDPRGVIQEANRAAASLLRVRPDLLAGKPLFVFVHTADRRALHDTIERAAHGEAAAGVELRLWPRKAGEVPAALYVAAARDGGGQLAGLRWIVHDLTELKEAHRRAVKAERLAAIGQTVAGLVHESGNALQRSQSCLRMLDLEVQDRPAALALIGRVQKAQDDLNRLFRDVREYAAPIRLDLQLCDLRGLWREAWEQTAPAREGRAAALRDFGGGADTAVEADPFRLTQIFRNLFDNALAACQGPAEVTVACAGAEVEGRPGVRVTVRDNGPGFTEEQRSKLFEPFHTTKARGTGLGLAICRRIAEAHGGHIAAGEGGGPGAEVVLELPRGGGKY